MVVALMALAGCWGEDDPGLTYHWDERKVLCSTSIDDIGKHAPWDLVEHEMARAQADHSVLMLHAHAPGASVSMAAIDRVLAMADAHHLEFLTYRDFEAGARPRAGLALAFDDHDIDLWYSARDVLGAHRARITLFVTYWATRPDEQRAELRTMAGEGDDVEPHSVNHLNAPQYVAEHGVAAYLADEVVPSIDELVAAGYPRATTFAYPGGASTDQINDAVLQLVPRVRVLPGSCPY